MPPAGSWLAVSRTAGRAGFTLDNDVTMSGCGYLLTGNFPDSQEVFT